MPTGNVQNISWKLHNEFIEAMYSKFRCDKITDQKSFMAQPYNLCVLLECISTVQVISNASGYLVRI